MTNNDALCAGDGLTLTFDSGGAARIGWGEPDWFGPADLTVRHGGARRDGVDLAPPRRGAETGRDDLGAWSAIELHWSGLPFALHTSVRAYADRPLLVFRLTAPDGIAGGGSGNFAEPTVAWPHFVPGERHRGGVAPQTRSFAYQWCEFALPLFGDADGNGFLFAPHRPAVAGPLLLIAPDGRTLLLGALDGFHEQIIAVPSANGATGIACGWHGDLTSAPPGFATELALWAAPSPRAALEGWSDALRRRHATVRPSRYADAGLARLSYWTDNGAHYYYRTAPDRDYAATLEQVVDDCAARDIPVELLQIDSWFYPHEHLRPVSPDGAPLVPPSGMLCWEPRADVFPDGLAALRRRLGGRPLAFHSRHFSAHSPYVQRFAMWVDGAYAHPRDGALFDHMLGAAASWGAVTYEQDWMVESFFGVRDLRAVPGRARAWQEDLDRAAGEQGLTLQWCMSTPADFLQSVTLRHLTSIRTSGDYRYLFDNGLNWVWFLHTNALARGLGLHAFKDVFLTDRSAEPYAEIEALLAALSAGPVGIGDAIGRADRELVLRTCREDGVLVKPDAPIAALDRCFRRHGHLEPVLLFGETYSAHPAGRWVYLAALHASRERAALRERLPLAEIAGLDRQRALLAYEWRSGQFTRLEPDGGLDVALLFQDWDYRILCPILPGDRTVFGDVRRYASVGDRRIGSIRAGADDISFDVLGTPGSLVEVQGYAAEPPDRVAATTSAGVRLLDITWEPSGRWTLRVALQSDRDHIQLRW